MIKSLCILLCRRRSRKIIPLIIILIFLLNAMYFVSLELYNTIKRKPHNPWFRRINYNKHPHEEKEMPVIVGHYVGGSNGGNLSEEDIHSNRYSPIAGAGEWGEPVQMSQRELVRARDLLPLHYYNILIGDKISINRSLPDMRSESCKQVQYDIDNLPTSSVIIVFHNEAWSTLMRTVMSVLLRSPQKLLKEIILVDDASERRYLGKDLEDAVAELEKVKIVRMKERTGLVGARLKGARAAEGDVLLFLDAHCEVTPGWIEPLLDRAGSDDVYICPHIDILHQDTFAYTKSIAANWGAFNWRLQFRWLRPSDEVLDQLEQDPSKPCPTPAMAGGLFAVRKSLFWRLGGYDESMKIWGGENLELSWRAWQCGARVEITSCSRVGHIFRRNSPYVYPGGVAKVVDVNMVRAATVWMDEWADFFFKFNPKLARIRDLQTVADRVEIRRNLKCKSFKWYLENVWKDHFFPTDDRWFGRIKNDMGACIGLYVKTPGLGSLAAGIVCGDDLDLSRLVVYTPDGRIMVDEGLCLEQGNGRALWKSCSGRDVQIWKQEGPRLKTLTGSCLTLVVKSKEDTSGEAAPMTSETCRVGDTRQIWHFERIPWR